MPATTTFTNVNPHAGHVRRRPDGKWLAVLSLGSGRTAVKRKKSFATRNAAYAWMNEMKAAGIPIGDAAEMTVAQAFDAYVAAKVLAPNTVESFVAARRRAAAYFGDTKLKALKPSQVDGFTAGLIKAGLAPGSTNTYTAKLSAVLRFAAADGALTFAPKVSRVRAPVVKREALTPADVKALYDAAPETFAPAIILGASAGLRASEAAAIAVGDIDFRAGTVTVSKAVDAKGRFVTTKTERSKRTIPVPVEVLAQLGEACRGRTPAAPVATNADDGTLTTNTFSKTFAGTADRAGLDVTFHALRKFYATTMLAAGVNPVSVAKYLGDTVETMLATYALPRATDDDAARAAGAIAFDAIKTA